MSSVAFTTAAHETESGIFMACATSLLPEIPFVRTYLLKLCSINWVYFVIEDLFKPSSVSSSYLVLSVEAFAGVINYL